MDHSPPGSSVHMILQARLLDWVAMPFSRGSSWPRDWPGSRMSPELAGAFFTISTTWENHRRISSSWQRYLWKAYMDGSLEIGPAYDNICFSNKCLLSTLPVKTVIKKSLPDNSFLPQQFRDCSMGLWASKVGVDSIIWASLHKADFPFATVQLVSNCS